MAYPKLINKCGYYYEVLFEVNGKGFLKKSLCIDIVLYQYCKIHELNYKEYFEKDRDVVKAIIEEINNTDFDKCEYTKKEEIKTYYME